MANLDFNGKPNIKDLSGGTKFAFETQPGGTPWANITDAHNATPYRHLDDKRYVASAAPLGYDIFVYTSTTSSGNSNISNLKKVENIATDAQLKAFKVAGAVGNGIADDTTAVNNAIANNSKIDEPGNFLVTNYINPYGTPIEQAAILKAVTGGKQLLNTYADRGQHITGKEYALPLVKRLYAGTLIKAGTTGDSTTEGGNLGNGISDPANNIDALLQTFSNNSGLNITYYNRGHATKNTEHWRSDYVFADITQNYQLYIIRWGINDPFYRASDNTLLGANLGQEASGRRTAADTIISLRAGLISFRATHDVSECTIVLMMPNSTFDIPNGRDARYYEQLRDGYLQAARDFKCVFIDTYAIWQDSTIGVLAGSYDNAYSDGRGIHPIDHFNIDIASLLFETLIPYYFRQPISEAVIDQKIADAIGNSAPVGGTSIPLSTANGLTALSNGSYQGVSTGNPGEYNAYGTSTLKLAANTNGRVMIKYNGPNSTDAIIGFKVGSNNEIYQNCEMGIFFNSNPSVPVLAATVLTGLATPTITSNTLTLNKWYGIEARDRGTANPLYIIIEASDPEGMATDKGSIVFVDNSELFAWGSADKNRIITTPKGLGLV